MNRKQLPGLCLLIAMALFVASCGGTAKNMPARREKIAVLDWREAASKHPEYRKWQQGEKILQDLQARRGQQEELARAQLGSLNKLRSLRRFSEDSFWQADHATRMVEVREREQKKLAEFSAQAEARVDEKLAPRKKNIEDAYQLEIFNLRAQLESLKLRPAERQAVEAKLKAAQQERGRRIRELEAERSVLLEQELAPYREAARKRMEAAAAEHREQIARQRRGKDEREQEILRAAPQALHNALSIMDKEIAKQREKNDALRRKIDGELAAQAQKLAEAEGYTIVFKEYKVNIKAEDITAKVIANLR